MVFSDGSVLVEVEATGGPIGGQPTAPGSGRAGGDRR
jgi:hypothetical protein